MGHINQISTTVTWNGNMWLLLDMSENGPPLLGAGGAPQIQVVSNLNPSDAGSLYPNGQNPVVQFCVNSDDVVMCSHLGA